MQSVLNALQIASRIGMQQLTRVIFFTNLFIHFVIIIVKKRCCNLV